jgi:hypothetical protein
MPARPDHLPPLAWRKSTGSVTDEECVEVARLGGSVLIRDSRDRSGPILAFSHTEWQALMTRIRGGRSRRH